MSVTLRLSVPAGPAGTRRASRPAPPRQRLSARHARALILNLFFGPDAEFVTARKKREAEAKAICARCPARDACLAYALDAGEAYGVWGGLTEDERRAMLRQRRAS